MSETVSLRVSIPVCSFRKGYAREYLETEEVPPPSTIYGFLLSLVGEEKRARYVGTRLAYAILHVPELSTILRTAWRVKTSTEPLGTGTNKRPDYQEILTGLEIAIWLGPGELAERIQLAKTNPSQIQRYGGLSLGESHDLVNDVDWFPQWPQKEGMWLVEEPKGDLPLPIWVDHIGSQGTIWRQFRLVSYPLEIPPEKDPRWITILSSEHTK